MSNDVSVTIDVANQSIISSDTSIIGVPTENFEIVTFDNKPCIRANGIQYATFTINPVVKGFSCDVFLQSVNNFTLLIEFDTILNTKYSLVYYPYGTWRNPDNLVFDRNNVLVGVWVTVTYSSANKTITFDNGTNKLVRVVDSAIVDLSIGSWNRYNIYLTNLSAETSTRYINKFGLSEIWTNTKNYIASQLLGKSNVGHTHSASDITSGLSTVATSGSYNDLSNKPTIPTKTSDLSNDSGFITSDNTKIPLAGTNALAGSIVPDTANAYDLGSSSKKYLNVWSNNFKGPCLNIWGNSIYPALEFKGDYSSSMTSQIIDGTGNGIGLLNFSVYNINGNNTDKRFRLDANGTWTWQGQAVQLVSDQRLKQQISQIDDDLLTAWEDVAPVQFKYNDAVKEKSDNARLHTGYVVQQIDEACKSHGVDVSKYGLYCHEEYAEETREVEQADGTKTTEVVRPASEHYSLRYTEALIVECAYLRKCIKELRTEIEQLKSSK